jgi:Ca2+-binding EF-hand superfamily protein
MKNVSRFLVAGAAVTLLPLAAFAQSPPSDPATSSPSQTQQGQGATFESLDVDGDGRISKTEADANATVKAQFSSYDVNGDGFIERAEVNKANDSTSETAPETPKQ